MTSTQMTSEKQYDLEQRTTEFGRAVIRLCRTIPRDMINSRLVSQVVGSAGSIGANYREANDALGKKDFIHRLKIARREAKEVIHWLELLIEANNEVRGSDDIIQEAIELKNIFSSIIKKIERRSE